MNAPRAGRSIVAAGKSRRSKTANAAAPGVSGDKPACLKSGGVFRVPEAEQLNRQFYRPPLARTAPGLSFFDDTLPFESIFDGRLWIST